MSVAEPFEILNGETIELLDKNNENILIRMIRIKIKGYIIEDHVAFDSNNRFYLIGSCLPNQTPNMEDCYYYLSRSWACRNC